MREPHGRKTMKSELDALMQAANLDGLVVVGNAEHNPPMTYLTGGGHVSHAVLIKKRGQPAVLFCNQMEREEAAKSGLKVVPLTFAPVRELLKDSAPQLFAEAGLSAGRIGVYGQADVSAVFLALSNLHKSMPALTFVGEGTDDNVFMCAMETKDEHEVQRIRHMGQVTVEVVGLVAEYLTSRAVRADDEVLLKEGDTPLTIGDVKSKISLWLAERGVETPEGFIFAIGYDAGIPHSVGNPQDVLRLGRTIVFDIYPAEAGGGYFYDFTRTWSLGYATPAAQELYDQVKAVYDKVCDNLDLNVPFKDYQRLACEEFEKSGHQTLLHTPSPVEGYVHSLGHGLGLNIHERPWSSLISDDSNRLQPGVVLTIEPGLYYPNKDMGVRIEDTYWVRPDGKMEILAEYPYDFVLQMKKWNKR
jgi:Xaa-Pro aminopeptidase